MTAAVKPKAPSKAAQFADAAEALGWTVKRERLDEGGRLVTATRGPEEYQLAWHQGSRSLVFTYGDYYAPGSDEPTEVVNVQQVLRDMRKIRSTNGALLPFDIVKDDNEVILKACAGKHLTWRNVTADRDEEGDLPRGGLHYKLTGEGAERVLHFPDQVHTGFRSVRLTTITDVQ